MNYLIAVWAVLTSLVAFVASLLTVRLRRAHKIMYKAWLGEMERNNEQMHELVSSVETARRERDNIRREYVDLAAQRADALDALAECQDTYKALERQTAEMPAQKRNTKGQFTKKVGNSGQ